MNYLYIKFTLLLFSICFFTNFLSAQITMPKSGSVSQTVVGGERFYDSGGAFSEYGDWENSTITLTSEPGTRIRVKFTDFEIEDRYRRNRNQPWEYYDYLDVSDASGSLGRFYGTTSPGTIISSGNTFFF